MDDKKDLYEDFGGGEPDQQAEEGNKEGFALEPTIQYAPGEVLNAMTTTILYAVQRKIMTVDSGILMVEMTRELLHWAYSKPGKHPTPADLLHQMALMQPTVAQRKPGSKTDA